MQDGQRFQIPISFKLITITVILLLSTAGFISFQSTGRFMSISKDREKDSNRDQSRARATEVEGLLISYIDKIKIVGGLLLKGHQSNTDVERELELTFRRDRDLVSVEVLKVGTTEPTRRVVNDSYLEQYKLTAGYIPRVRSSQRQNNTLQFAAIFAGDVEIRNSSLEGGAPLLTVGIPLAKDDYGNVTYIAVSDIRLARLQKVFGNISEREMYLVDKEGNLLAHPSEERVFRSESMVAIPIVEAAIKSQFKQAEKNYSTPSGEAFTGAYTKTSLGPTVVAVASERVILEAARQVQKESFYVAGRVLSVALFAIFVFSITLTAPIEKLVEITSRVAKGQFDKKSDIHSRDEVGQLGQAFDHMIEGLQERDKVKNMLNKFHGSSVAEDLLKGDLALGGTKKEVTVFFSDIRDFTKFSEGHTPEEVVDMLNEYFQIMVGIINRNNGIVDKFIGDAIMAVWGAPTPHEDDAVNAVGACVQMRQALEKLNEARTERGQVPIKIGIGLHRGFAISGTIGSDERMEYTVIGDAVNQAARIEASTKAFGTDLLLSDSLAEDVKHKYIIEEAGKAEVKGKSKPLTMFKVRGYYDEEGNEVRVKTEYSDFAAEAADKVKVAS